MKTNKIILTIFLLVAAYIYASMLAGCDDGTVFKTIVGWV